MEIELSIATAIYFSWILLYSLLNLRFRFPIKGFKNCFMNLEREVNNGATLRYATQGYDVHMRGEVFKEGTGCYPSTGLNQQKGELFLQKPGCNTQFLCEGGTRKLNQTKNSNQKYVTELFKYDLTQVRPTTFTI